MALKQIFSKRNMFLLAFIFVVLIVGAVARSAGIRFSVKTEGFEEGAKNKKPGQSKNSEVMPQIKPQSTSVTSRTLQQPTTTEPVSKTISTTMPVKPKTISPKLQYKN